MNYVVKFTDLASEDIDHIIDYIAQDSPQNALEFIDALEERIRAVLCQFPETGSQYKQAYYFAFDNYIVVYDIDESSKTVDILMVSEGHRQWQSVFDKR